MRAPTQPCIVFFFGRKRRPQPKPVRPVAAIPNEQKRAAFRMPVQFDVQFTMRGRIGRRQAAAHDLSSGGLRLQCDEDILRNAVLDLDFLLPADFLAEMTVEREVYEQTPFGLRPDTVKSQPPPFPPMRMSAQVRSTFYVPATKQLAHGLQFVDVDPQMQEELQRFIHMWQLHRLRARGRVD